MRVRGKIVTELTVGDLDALIAAQVPESRVLEYKADLPGGRDDDKREFLADVTALANTRGGAIIYGVATTRDGDGKDTGIAASIVGVSSTNVDAEVLRLQSMLRDGVSPSLTRVAFHRIELAEARGPVLVLGVARGLLLPHMVAFNRSGKVFRRSDADKYQVDVHELRRMILEGEDWVREAETFRRERMRAARALEIVPNLDVDAAVMLHVLPLGRLDALHDLRRFADDLNMYLRPPNSMRWDKRWNLDGFIILTESGSYGSDDCKCYSYVQWLRSGGVEVCSTRFQYKGDGPNTMFDGPEIDRFVVDYTTKAISFMRERFELDAPFIVLLSVAGIKGAYMSNSDSIRVAARGPFIQDTIFLPAVVLDDADSDISAAVQPMLDVLWQAAGWSGDPRTPTQQGV